VLLDVCRDMEELCPDALLLNYVNPMAMLCWAAAEASPIRTVGLCHSVQHTTGELAADLGSPPRRSTTTSPGINHMAFFLRLERDGQDLYPALHDVLERNAMPEANQVRYEVLRHFGSFVTESSEHFAEYVPWFIKAHRPDLVERYRIPLDEYPRRCETALAEWEAERARLERPGPIRVEPSVEYGGDIIRACETGEPFTFNGNVPNRHAGGLLIDNLPADCCVEVPCVAVRRRDRAAGRRGAPALARRAHADERVGAGPHGAGRVDRRPGGRPPCRDARPPHGRRAAARRDRGAGGRPARRARGPDPVGRPARVLRQRWLQGRRSVVDRKSPQSGGEPEGDRRLPSREQRQQFSLIGMTDVGCQLPPRSAPMGSALTVPRASSKRTSTPSSGSSAADPRAKNRSVGSCRPTQIGAVVALEPSGMSRDVSWSSPATVHGSLPATGRALPLSLQPSALRSMPESRTGV
jgi:hypothetical protein